MEARRRLDAELGATIERLQQARLELGTILRTAGPTDLPPEIAPAAVRANLTEADRSFVAVMSRVLGPSGLDAYRELLQDDYAEQELAEFDHLPEDADERTRAELVERITPLVRDLLARHPPLDRFGSDAPGGRTHFARTMDVALRDLYNPAQLDVLLRLGKRLVAES